MTVPAPRPAAEDPWRCHTCGHPKDAHPYRHPFRYPATGRPRQEQRP